MSRITTTLTTLCLALATGVAAQGDLNALAQVTPTAHVAYAGSQANSAAVGAEAAAEYSAVSAAENVDAAATVLLPHYAAGDAALAEALRVRLQYPAVAQENGIEGTCVLRVRIDEGGRATVTGVVESLSADCDAAATAAVEGLGAFTPARLDGRAFGRTVRIAVEFKL